MPGSTVAIVGVPAPVVPPVDVDGEGGSIDAGEGTLLISGDVVEIAADTSVAIAGAGIAVTGDTVFTGGVTINGATSVIGSSVAVVGTAGLGLAIIVPVPDTSDISPTAHWTRNIRSGAFFEQSVLVVLNTSDIPSVASRSYGEGKVIGTAGVGGSLGQFTSALFGTIFRGKIECLVAPVGGSKQFAVSTGTDAVNGDADPAGLVQLYDRTTDWAAGDTVTFAAPAADTYLYLTGSDATTGLYSAGTFLLTFQCLYPNS